MDRAADTVIGEEASGTEHPRLDDAAARMRAPWAASVAGLLFAVLFTTGLVLVRSSPLGAADDAELEALVAAGRDLWLFVGALYLLPFAGIMFLWFVAVIRDRVGDREDRFFGTVFFGSGLLFVATLFAAAAVAGSSSVAHRYLGLDAPSGDAVASDRALAYTLLFGFSTRAAAVCLFSMGTLGIRTGALPRPLVWAAWGVGLALLLVVAVFDWIVLVFPAWVAVASLVILSRARRERRTAA
jgi:hypothetical protein